ncbi:MAG: ELM1/GtrOC1 family putative glycosyltransferase [Synergistaceae bacterium]|nr:ELM1/GtrOC1 family putative glycosyltransferase [Synergistaceae bacterium]
MSGGCALRVIVILSDGIRGHVNQSRGVAHWLAELTGAELLETEVPLLSGTAKARSKAAAKALAGGTRRDARDWLAASDGDALIRRVGQWFAERNIQEGSGTALIISAGSTPAPYNIALGYIWRCACATIMTPGTIGTEPFDFAIVPEHDYPERKPNILVTLGSPNFVIKENLEKEARALLAEYPSESEEIWSILIGGDDANYVITPEWVKKQLGQILNLAQHSGADVYITTSRRTGEAAVKTVKALAAHSPSVRYLLVASEDDFNPIPAMLGFSTEVFCTEDSVNMVSETITGGHRAVLLRVGHRGGFKGWLQRLTASLVNSGALAPNMLWGIPRFDLVFDHFARNGVLIDYRDWLRVRREGPPSREAEEMAEEFNEARRAARWIYDNWK